MEMHVGVHDLHGRYHFPFRPPPLSYNEKPTSAVATSLRARKSIYGRKQAREIVSSKVAVRLALDSGTRWQRGNDETRIVSPPRPGPLPIMRIRWNTSVDKREHVPPPYALQPRIIKLDRQVAPVSRTTVITGRLVNGAVPAATLCPQRNEGLRFFLFPRILESCLAEASRNQRCDAREVTGMHA